MSVTDNTEKKFVIKHTFDDPMKLKNGDTVESPIEYHFGIPWKIRIVRYPDHAKGELVCLITSKSAGCYLHTRIAGLLCENQVSKSYGHSTKKFSHKDTSFNYFIFNNINRSMYSINERIPVEFNVEITKMTGNFEKKKLRNFDDDAAKEDSDVTLIVKDQKFHVCKMYLSTHSTYFKALFSGNFSESQKSEIELKDIDPEAFQDYLELIYGESYVEDYSILGILQLADFFDSKTAIRKCKEFLEEKSKLPLKDRFHAAIKYKFDNLKEKCMSEMKTRSDFLSVVPDDSADFDHTVWKELFLKCYSSDK